jgi:hypothetical protein
VFSSFAFPKVVAPKLRDDIILHIIQVWSDRCPTMELL